MKQYIVDACVLIGYLKKEPVFDKVKEILRQAFDEECSLIMSSVVVGETYFSACRYANPTYVENFLSQLPETYGLQEFPPSALDCLEAAKYKTLGGIAYFDCFNLVLAKKYPKATILTLDTEYKKFEKDFKIEFL